MKQNIMIEEIDKKVSILLRYRDQAFVVERPELRATICTMLEKCYFLQHTILLNRRFTETKNNYFFLANVAANRHYRDWGLDEVADIYNEMRTIAIKYMD